jgi:hypothetical protein
MLAIYHVLGRPVVKTQGAYFSNISDVRRGLAIKSNGDMQQHIGYVRGKFQKNNVLAHFLWSHIT